MTIPPSLPRDPTLSDRNDPRTRRFLDMAAGIFNSLIGAGLLVPTGPGTWAVPALLKPQVVLVPDWCEGPQGDRGPPGVQGQTGQAGQPTFLLGDSMCDETYGSRPPGVPSTGGSGMAIGATVSGGTSNGVLYVDGSGNLANNGRVIYDGNTFQVQGTAGNLVGRFFFGVYEARLCDDFNAYAARLSDNVHIVVLCDGTWAINRTGLINYTPGASGDWNGTPPDDIDEALDRLATLAKALNGGTGP